MVTVASLNFDSSMRRERGFSGECFPELKINNRVALFLPVLQQFLRDTKPDIFCLQECRRASAQADSLTPIVQLLMAEGYAVYTQRCDENIIDGTGFVYVTALRKASTWLHFGNSERLYVSTNPRVHTAADQLLHSPGVFFGEKEERSIQILHVYADRLDGSRQWFSVINAHMLVGLESRLGGARVIAEYVRKVQHRIIMVGDFNTFPDCGGADQVRIICDEGNVCDLPIVCSGDANESPRSSSTFVPFVDDLVGGSLSQEEIKMMKSLPDPRSGFFPPHMPVERTRVKGGVLDHIFVRGFTTFDPPMPYLRLLSTDPSIAPADLEDDDQITEYVRTMTERRLPPFLSDHPLVVAYGLCFY